MINNALYGIVSSGSEVCGWAPIVYTKVPFFVDWITAEAKSTN